MRKIYNSFHTIPLIRFLAAAAIVVSFSNCSVSRSSFSPSKKYSPEQLQSDYAVFRGALEETHPSVYWYTTKQEMDAYFDWGAAQLTDSLNEEDFKRVLSYVIARINCGHTVVRNSRQFLRYRDTTARRYFPLSLKIWQSPSGGPDTAVVAANLNLRDTILRRGTIITKIDNVPIRSLLDTFFRYVSSDGYNYTHKYQAMSNRGGFGSSYMSLYGMKSFYKFDFIDSLGRSGSIRVPAFAPVRDTTQRRPPQDDEVISRSDRRKRIMEMTRNIKIDTVASVGYLELGSFGRALQLKRFFRYSFRLLRKTNTKSLIIDVRGNGGGSVTNSNLLTKFIADKKFKLADSLYSNTRNSRYKKHIDGYFFHRLFMLFMTKKRKDGKYHFGYFERHYFKPKKKNHYNGKVYVLTGGNSFSATTLFAQIVREQPNVTIVGEETGGAAYGNSAWLIPDAELPLTKLRFRLPLFRLVINKNIPKDGRGVLPEVGSYPSVEAIRKNIDFKLQTTQELIRQDQSLKQY